MSIRDEIAKFKHDVAVAAVLQNIEDVLRSSIPSHHMDNFVEVGKYPRHVVYGTTEKFREKSVNFAPWLIVYTSMFDFQGDDNHGSVTVTLESIQGTAGVLSVDVEKGPSEEEIETVRKFALTFAHSVVVGAGSL